MILDTMQAGDVRKELQSLADPKKARVLQGFFKTGPGQYGEGDIFLGIRVPQSRRVAKKFKDLSLDEIEMLLNSKIHEERLVALLILVHKHASSDKAGIAKFYLDHMHSVNNWDLVDLTAPTILGSLLSENSDRSLLYRLARSENIWERRVAIVSTLYFIRKNDLRDTLKIAEILLKDRHDLIHKAAGWMLREVGKRKQSALEAFLRKHHKTMPRTMLRYAIERLSDRKRQHYLMT
jgi:3-methyladenine DNA glycosylase AlkD